AKAKELQELWAKGGDPAKLKQKLGKWLAAEKDGWKQRLLRVRLSGLLLQMAAADPERDLKRVRDLLAEPEEAAYPRPAEAQYLTLLTRDLVAQPGWAEVKDALAVRRRAEEAAVGLQPGEAAGRLPLYAERLLPWIRAAVEDGDKARREGQDLLLAAQDA